MSNKKVLLSGIQPTGKPHIGNYFGALKNWADLQDNNETYLMIVNYHALTTISNAQELKDNTYNIALDLLAIGVDPDKVNLFRQSDVPEHTELAWIFNCLVTMPWLARAHAYKDKTDKGIEATVGLYDYPVLMAADILMYDTDIVPVGKDQKQHVEMAREVAMKFNNTYGEVFKFPQELIMEEVATVPGTDGQKMSKSYGNTIPLFASDEEILKAVMGIVTDSSGERPENVYAIHKLFRKSEELENIYEEHKGKYKNLKEILAQDIINYIKPMREKREELEKNPEYVEKVLQDGATRARAKAIEKMKIVREKVGLI